MMSKSAIDIILEHRYKANKPGFKVRKRDDGRRVWQKWGDMIPLYLDDTGFTKDDKIKMYEVNGEFMRNKA